MPRWGMAYDAPGVPTRAIIYCRISRDREGAGLGVERQRADCEALAKQLGIEVVATYPDNDLSAYSGKPRPGYRKLLDALREGRADTVLAWHTDRLHRSPAELEEYIDVCEPRGVQTLTVKAGNLDLSTATGRMIARQLGVQARYEVERMVERQKRKRDEMAQHGQFFGGRRPFGYEADGVTPRSTMCLPCGRGEPADFAVRLTCSACGEHGGIEGWACTKCGASNGRHVWAYCRRCDAAASVLDGSEFQLIRHAADAILAGTSLRALAAEWNRADVRTSTGGEWKGEELREMLRRPRNAGIVRHRGKEAGPAEWPAALDEATWRSLVALFADPARRISPGNERKYLGSGLYRCGLCPNTMRASTSNKMAGGTYFAAYSCRASKHVVRKVEPLDDFVQELIIERLSRADAGELLAQRAETVDVAAAQTDMRQARATINALAAELGAGTMGIEEWRIASAGARERLQRAEAVLGRAVEADPLAGLVGAEDVAAAWEGLDLSRKRAVLSRLMTVTVHPARRGRLPGGVYFDTSTVETVWK